MPVLDPDRNGNTGELLGMQTKGNPKLFPCDSTIRSLHNICAALIMIFKLKTPCLPCNSDASLRGPIQHGLLLSKKAAAHRGHHTMNRGSLASAPREPAIRRHKGHSGIKGVLPLPLFPAPFTPVSLTESHIFFSWSLDIHLFKRLGAVHYQTHRPGSHQRTRLEWTPAKVRCCQDKR